MSSLNKQQRETFRCLLTRFSFFYTKKNIIGGSFILVLKVALMIRSFRIIIYFYSYYSNFEKRKEIYKIDSKLLINDIYIYIYSTKKNVTISIPLSLLTRISFDILLQATKSYDKISAKKIPSSLSSRHRWFIEDTGWKSNNVVVKRNREIRVETADSHACIDFSVSHGACIRERECRSPASSREKKIQRKFKFTTISINSLHYFPRGRWFIVSSCIDLSYADPRACVYT